MSLSTSCSSLSNYLSSSSKFAYCHTLIFDAHLHPSYQAWIAFLQYYRSPGGKRFRSRNEALKSLGFGEDKSKEKKSPSKTPAKAPARPKDQKLTHEDALAKAKAEAAESPVQLPIKLGNGVKVLK